MRRDPNGARIGRAIALMTLLLIQATGCHRGPYIDQSQTVVREPLESLGNADSAVQLTSHSEPLQSQDRLPLPELLPPLTVSDPDAEQIWELTLEDAIHIGLENAEVIRVIVLSAQGIPVAGFEPAPLNLGTGTALGAGGLATVYDPAIQETQIAAALAAFDATLTSQLTWGRSVNLVNNSLAAGAFFNVGGTVPVVSENNNTTWTTSLTKTAITGTQFNVTHNIAYAFTNSPINVTPSAYTVNTQVGFTHPLLGGTPNAPSGVEANRAGIVIARLNADSSVWAFKRQILTAVRSIETQYWALSQQLLQLWARKTAVELGQQIVRRAQAQYNVGRGSIADVAEAARTLANFNLQYVQTLAQTVTTERQLRNILGLPPADGRRIIPATAPLEARVVPQWNEAIRQMIAFNPDIIQLQLFVRVAELQLLLARNTLLPTLNLNALYQLNGLSQNLDTAHAIAYGKPVLATDPIIGTLQTAAGLETQPGFFENFETWQVGLTFSYTFGQRGPFASVRSAQYQVLRQKALLKQVVHQETHALARFFIEVDSNFKILKLAQEVREAARVELQVARARYAVSDIAIDRYLEAVSQWANAVANEAQFKTSYNNSLAVLDEANRTLLAYNNIRVAEGAHPRQAYIQAVDQRAAHGQLKIGHDGPYHPNAGTGPISSDPVNPRTPPGYEDPNGSIPGYPAPSGPLGPPSSPVPPASPAGQPNFLGMTPGDLPADYLQRLPGLPELPPSPLMSPEVLPASGVEGGGLPVLPNHLPNSMIGPPPTSSQPTTVPASHGSGLPSSITIPQADPGPIEVDLPPLPDGINF